MTDTASAATSPRPGSLWSRVRSFSRPIVFAPLLALIALGAWAFASPIGSSPDDDFHLASIWCANADRTDLCEPGPATDEREIPLAITLAPCFAFHEEVSAACQEAIDAADSEPTHVTDRGSFDNTYPPVYYATMNLFASSDLMASGVVMRFVNIALFIASITALFVLLPVRRRPSLVLGWLVTVVPLGLFLIASNNPSSWAITGVATSWLSLLGYFETTGRRRIALAVIFVLSTIMAAGSRADAAAFTLLGAAIVVLLTFRRDRRYLLAALLPVVLALVALAFFLSSSQSLAAVSGLATGAPSGRLAYFALFAYNLLNVPSLWAGVFGGWGLGWLDTTMPAVVFFGALAVFVGVAFVGIGVHAWRKNIAVVVVALTLLLLPAYILGRSGDLVGQNVQPRYLLPLIVMLAGLAALAVGSRVVRLSPTQSVLVVAALGVAQSLALHVNLRRYLTGTDVPGVNLDSSAEWWWSGMPLSPMAIWIIGSLAFAALAAVLVQDLARASRANAAALRSARVLDDA
ncbi:MAG: hypothetical protein JWP85_2460 [Rhodoglobus sp.]|nr:hypothetical protein [Rhodoglobus sp.]